MRRPQYGGTRGSGRRSGRAPPPRSTRSAARAGRGHPGRPFCCRTPRPRRPAPVGRGPDLPPGAHLRGLLPRLHQGVQGDFPQRHRAQGLCVLWGGGCFGGRRRGRVPSRRVLPCRLPSASVVPIACAPFAQAPARACTAGAVPPRAPHDRRRVRPLRHERPPGARRGLTGVDRRGWDGGRAAPQLRAAPAARARPGAGLPADSGPPPPPRRWRTPATACPSCARRGSRRARPAATRRPPRCTTPSRRVAIWGRVF
jgi:hypothetical protein